MPTFPNKSTWIFDFDGTLVDSMRQLTELAATILTRYYGTPDEEAREQYRQTSGLPFVQQVARLHPDRPENEAAVTEFERTKAERYLDRPLYPEVPSALCTLRSRGGWIAVSSSNGQSLVETYCARHNLPIDCICGWRPAFTKGAVHFGHILRQSSQPREAALFVGDSLRDAREATDHGIDFVARAGTFAAEEFHAVRADIPVIHSLTELL
ncbi:MAG: HAD hydrolase-like protein [Deltaproteobacteria bacterium]|nr:HAD hydrolase-like protein [Deltaproteobacteria bacterium]